MKTEKCGKCGSEEEIYLLELEKLKRIKIFSGREKHLLACSLSGVGGKVLERNYGIEIQQLKNKLRNIK